MNNSFLKTQVPNRYKTFREFIQRPFSTNYLTRIYYGIRTELARNHRTLLSLLKDKPIHFLQTFKQQKKWEIIYFSFNNKN